MFLFIVDPDLSSRLVAYASAPAIKTNKMFGRSKKMRADLGLWKRVRGRILPSEPHPHPGPPLEGGSPALRQEFKQCSIIKDNLYKIIPMTKNLDCVCSFTTAV
jgi:hypothetical protein